jgi:preprotein translocase subunit SecD
MAVGANDLGPRDVKSAERTTSIQTGERLITIQFTQAGARRAEKLTGDAIAKFDEFRRAAGRDTSFRYLMGPRMAIVVDGRLRAAPNLNSQLSDVAEIAGFKGEEANSIVAGLAPEIRIPCRLRHLSTVKVQPDAIWKETPLQ